MTGPSDVGRQPPLNRSCLAQLRQSHRADIELPDAALLDLPERVLQFGTGAFLRGFVESFIDDANRRGAFDGRVVAVASTPTGGGRHRGLGEQDGLYTLVTRAADGEASSARPRVIASLSRVLAAESQWDAVLACARDPRLEIVFSNTTEVGIAADIADAPDASPPRSYPAKLTRFLFERAQTFEFDPARGLAVVPCELIEDNADMLYVEVVALATRWQLDRRFIPWLDDSVSFCNTLVDRIVPSLSDLNERRTIEDRLGYADELITICEPYRLFAIQADHRARARLRFASGDPAIILCDDVSPYRLRKLHLLNGPHTVMASVGLLAGYQTVGEAMSSGVGELIQRAMREEIVPHLDVPDAAGFAEDVLVRFANPAIHHALLDIMLQATTKMRVRVVPLILAYAHDEHSPPAALTLGFAALVRCLRGDLDTIAQRLGRPAPPDAGADRIRAAWRSAHDPADLARRVCADATLWGASLDQIPGFTRLVAEFLSAMDAQGTSDLIDRLNGKLATARGRG